MRVGADDQLAGQNQAVFRQHGVADAALPHLEVPLDAHVVRELAGQAAEGGARGVLRRLEVVLRDGDAVWIPDLIRAHLLAHDPARGRDRQVVAHREIDFGQDEVTGDHALAPGAPSQDLLRHRHRHIWLILQPFNDRITGLGRGQIPSDVACAFTRSDG